MAKLIVELPEEIHKELKRKALLHHRTIKEVVTDLLEEFLSRGRKEGNMTETGFCGRWEDKRSAAAIIADIKSHRAWFGKKGRRGA